MGVCNICPRGCNADRSAAYGVCGAPDTLRIARYGLHEWEEPPISGGKGSGTIFFSGCNLKCVYCQNHDVSHRALGENITVRELADIFKKLEDMGAENINLVTANHYLPEIFRAIDIYKPGVPVCYNTSSYDRPDIIERCKDYVDIYLADIKYSDARLAEKYSAAADYPDVAYAAVLAMSRQKKDRFEGGMMKEGVIIRHLVLPNALDNTFGVIDWLSENVDKSAIISLMSQYVPIDGVPSELNRKLKPIEYKLAVNKLIGAGFLNSFVQEKSSADSAYIPEFYGKTLR